jgi:hypothetical protein
MQLIAIYAAICGYGWLAAASGRDGSSPISASGCMACDNQGPPAFIVGGFLVGTNPAKMLQHGYNGSEVAPYYCGSSRHIVMPFTPRNTDNVGIESVPCVNPA